MINNIGGRLRSCSLMERQLPVPYCSQPAFQFENFGVHQEHLALVLVVMGAMLFGATQLWLVISSVESDQKTTDRGGNERAASTEVII